MTHIAKYTSILLYTASLLLVAGCAKTSIDEIPSYIAVDSISVNVTSFQGTASHKVVDTWVYAGNDLVGGFELPARFPVLKSGSTELTIQAGIKLNGMNETRVPYPLFAPVVKTVTLEREKVTDLGHLKFSYSEDAIFAWLENFEQYNPSVDTTARSEINLQRIELPELATVYPYETNEYAMKVEIPNDSLVFEAASHDQFKLPTDGRAVFLELNYKANNSFTIGLFKISSVVVSKEILVVNPSSTWNKIYINFTPTLSESQDITYFKVFFIAKKDEKVDKAEIYLDNIKLVHIASSAK